MIPHNFIFNNYNESRVVCCVQLLLKLKLKFEKFPILEKNYNLDSYLLLFDFRIKRHAEYVLFVNVMKQKKWIS